MHEGDTKRSAVAHLRIDVLLIGQVPHQLLDIDGRHLAVQVALAVDPAHVHEVVRVGNDSRHRRQDVLIHLVQLPTFTSWYKKRACLFLLGGKYNTYVQTTIWLIHR